MEKKYLCVDYNCFEAKSFSNIEDLKDYIKIYYIENGIDLKEEEGKTIFFSRLCDDTIMTSNIGISFDVW